MNGLHSSNGALGQASVRGRVGDRTGAGVAVRVHPELGVRVDIHVKLNTLACGKAVKLSLQCLSLDTVTGGRTLVVLSAGGGAGTLCLAPGLVWPVPVDITPDAAGRGRCLPILSPQTVAVLREIEAVRIYDGEDVEVVLVLESGRCGIGGRQQLVCGVFIYHRRDPFSRMHGAVPDNRLLRAFASAAPDVNALYVTSFERLACRNDF